MSRTDTQMTVGLDTVLKYGMMNATSCLLIKTPHSVTLNADSYHKYISKSILLKQKIYYILKPNYMSNVPLTLYLVIGHRHQVNLSSTECELVSDR